jgi:hypothetical protein
MSDLIVRSGNKSERLYRPHPFPVIDFKFRNSGDSVGFMTAFHIDVLRAEVDVSPELRFDWRLRSSRHDRQAEARYFHDQHSTIETAADRLEIEGSNMGWGAARELALSLGEPLCSLFSTVRATATVLEDEIEQVVGELCLEDLNMTAFRRAVEHTRPLSDSQNTPSWNRPWQQDRFGDRRSDSVADFISQHPAVLVDRAEIAWMCTDVKGRQVRGQQPLEVSRWSSALLVTESGFVYLPQSPPCGAAAPPGPTFCALVDPDKGAHVRSYRISRRIEAGDIERFQILIGATKSCFLDIRLAFDIDGRDRVQSGLFEVDIENRRDQRFNERFRDGQEILATVTEEQERHTRHRGFGLVQPEW